MLLTADILDRAGTTLGGFLPRLGGALVLLIAGIFVARLVGRLLERALRRAGADGLAERTGVHDVLAQMRLPRSLARVTARALMFGLIAVVVFAALSLLGLQFLSQSLNQAVLFLPKLAAAAALLIAGVVVAALARRRVERLAYQMDFPVPLGRLVQVAIVAVFAITAAAQVAISTVFLLILVAILIAAAAMMVALAFGLGGREAARALSAGRYVRGAFEVGQVISVGDMRGAIVAIEPTTTVLRDGGGQRLRVPNHLLLESVVTVHEPPGEGDRDDRTTERRPDRPTEGGEDRPAQG